MKVLRGTVWIILGLCSVLAFGSGVQARTAPGNTSRLIIYPSANDSIDQLKTQGVKVTQDYGSYWLVEATDDQVKSLNARYGDRAVNADYLNKVELAATSVDTTAGEPAVPNQLRQGDTGGKRLRLIQFKGPVKPEWLQQVKSAGDVKVVSYIPNNAYVIWLDRNGEAKLKTQLVPKGSIQWIGPYHPYYKIQTSLLTAIPGNDEQMIEVRVGIVDDAGSGRTADMLQSLDLVQGAHELTGQKVFGGRVSQSVVSQIAQQPDVLWVQKVEPKRLMDEVQDLILAAQINGPGHGPSTTMGITNYLDFLINTVGGGLASFTNQFTYPIVDVADTGFGATFEEYPGSALQPSFNEFGIEYGTSRLAYQAPGNGGYFAGATKDAGCTALNKNFFGTEDFYDHGTRVASVIAGYDTQTNVTEESIYSTIVTQTFSASSTCTGTNSQTNAFTVATSPCPFTTNLIVNCLNIGDIITTNLDLPTEIIVTQTVDNVHRDLSGFQLGMGVSPFGRIGSSRIWRQDADTVDTPPRVRFLPPGQPLVPCMEGLFPVLFFEAYSNGARIQNNSWGANITDTGEAGGQYTVDSQTYDIAVRDALLVGSANNVPGPSALNQEFIMVFAANSTRSDLGASGNVGGFGDIRVTAPGTGKNVITVGSSESVRLDDFGCGLLGDKDNSFDIWETSAFGPTLDGRFKPEIVAPGTTIWAAKSELAAFFDQVNGITPTINNDPNGFLGTLNSSTCLFTNLYCSPPAFFDACFPILGTGGGVTYVAGGGLTLYDCDSGSSYAAPAVSGAIQLLWWYFENRLTNEQGKHLLQPSPAMAKAYLCNAARYLPITNPQYGTMDTLPSTAQGMGELDLQRMFDGVPRVIRDESTPRAIDPPLITTNPAPQQTYFSQPGQSYEVSGQVVDPTKPFRVTLAWTDAPGNPAASKQLVNDLDLTVTIGGQTYKGNVFAEDHSVPGGAYDGINNMESVFLPPGQTGAWKVVVQAMDIAGDGVPNVGSSLDQDFALVVYNSQNPSDVPNLATNNSCQTAMVITDIPFGFTNTLSKAVYHNVHPSPEVALGGVDEFFKIVRPTPGAVFTINTSNSTFDAVLSVWQVQVIPQSIYVRGECGALVEVASNDDAVGGGPSQVTFTADGSNDYFIVVEPHNDGTGGALVLNVNATTPAVTITPNPVQFADQPVETTGAVQTVTYLNSATVNIGVSSVSIAGANSNDFIIESQGCAGSVVRTGQFCVVSIAFAPTAGGFRTAQLVFYDDATGSPRSVPLSGFGVAPEPAVCLSTMNLAFGLQAVAATSAVHSVTITNCGTLALVVSNNLSITGVNAGDFAVASSSCSSVTPGGTCVIGVTFAPTTTGLRSALLTITSNATNSPNTVTLTGTAEVPTPQACLSSGASIAFGNQSPGETSAVRLVTITNCGTALLDIYSISLGANAGNFILSGPACTGDIGIGSNCSFGVSFAPTNFTASTASLIISNNTSDNPKVVTLTGSGAASQPDLLISTKVKAKTFVGNHIQNSTGASQTVVQSVKRGKMGIFYVAIQNAGNIPGSFRIQGAGDDPTAGFTVKYFLGTKGETDITSSMENGGYFTTLGAGAITGDSSFIRVEVTVSRTATKQSFIKNKISGFASDDSSKRDSVQAVVLVK